MQVIIEVVRTSFPLGQFVDQDYIIYADDGFGELSPLSSENVEQILDYCLNTPSIL